MHPPHLPKKQTREPLLKRHPALPWLLLVVALSMLSALAATLTTVAWLGPSSHTGVIRTLRAQLPRLMPDEVTLDPFIEQQTRQRMVTLYDTRKKLNSVVYPAGSAIGVGILLNQDGWFVMQYPNVQQRDIRFLEAIDHVGSSYKIEQYFVDPVSGLTYIKADGDAFRGDVSFISWDNTDFVDESQLGFYATAVEPVIFSQRGDVGQPGEVTRFWEPTFLYRTQAHIPIGTVIIHPDGRVIGIVGENHTVIPGWIISHQLQPLFQDGQLRYTSINIHGYAIERLDTEQGTALQSGFYVTRSNARPSSSTIGVGDIITHVNEKPVGANSTPKQLFLSQTQVAVRALRDGEEIDIVVQKEHISL
jgi:hypothetical protein